MLFKHLRCKSPRRRIGEALEHVLLHVVQAVVRWGFAGSFAGELRVKVGHVAVRADLGEEWWPDSLVIYVIKVDISEIGVGHDFFRIRGSRPQSEAGHFDKELIRKKEISCLDTQARNKTISGKRGHGHDQ